MRNTRIFLSSRIIFIFIITLFVSSPKAQVFIIGDHYEKFFYGGPKLTADFDGDLDIDIAVGQLDAGEIWIYTNDGSTHFSHTQTITVSFANLQTADLNGDGYNDLIFYNEKTSLSPEWGLTMYFNNGDGTFYEGYKDTLGSVFMCTADFNGDGIMDVAVSNKNVHYYNLGMLILFGTGGGNFAPPINILPEIEQGTAITAVDLDNDNDEDIMCYISTVGRHSLLNFGNGTFADPLPTGGAGIIAPLADFNGDNYVDMIGYIYGDCDVDPAYSLNNRDGTFSHPVKAFETAGVLSGASMGAADFNGDGYADIAWHRTDLSKVTIRLNDGRPLFPNTLADPLYDVSAGSWGMGVSDLDQDGDPDLLIFGRDSSLTIMLSQAVQHKRPVFIPDDMPTIQDGINYAWNLDTVLVQPGTYVENLNFNGKNIVLMSTDYAAKKMLGKESEFSYQDFSTIIDGGAAGRVFLFENFEDTRSVIAGFIIQNGYAEVGAGVRCYDTSAVTIIHNIFRDNHTSGGAGAIFVHKGDVIIKNNLIINNSSELSWGGGIYLLHSKGIIANNIIYGNSAVNGGGGLYVNTGTPSIYNNIIWNNTSTSGGNEIGWLDIFPTITYSDIKGGWTGTGNLDLDPMFVDPANGDFRLMAGSPCIDAGDPNSPLDPDGTLPDMGAYYYFDPSDVQESGLPYTYNLLQNYPNPFNPSTIINWEMPQAGLVSLKIYDVLGREVITLVNEELNAGKHETVFEAANFSSGVYIYRINTGDFIQTKKMILLK